MKKILEKDGNNIAVLKDIHVTYRDGQRSVEVLKGLNLEIPAGSHSSLVGPSGSGKSTFMAVLAGLMPVDSGQIIINDRDLSAMDEDERAILRRAHIGLVFQHFHLIPSMTALENVKIPLELAGNKAAKAQAEDMLDSVGLLDRMHHYPAQLSGGEQQRVAIARALVTRPRLLIADEPTGNLDQDTGQVVTDLLFEKAEKYGTALMLITHDPVLAKRCRTRLKMENGHIKKTRS